MSLVEQLHITIQTLVDKYNPAILMDDEVNDEINKKHEQNKTIDLHIHDYGMNGFVNNSNSCYMNSTLQCLLHTYDLIGFLTDKRIQRFINPNKYESRLLVSFINMLYTYWKHSETVINPGEFKQLVGLFNTQFRNHHQQDSHELLNYLFDTFHECTKYEYPERKLDTYDEHYKTQLSQIDTCTFDCDLEKLINVHYGFSVINNIFAINELQELRCNSCKHLSLQIVHSYSMILELIKPRQIICRGKRTDVITLYTCLNNYFSQCEMTDWKCNECGELGGVKIHRLINTPSNLVITLNRFVVDQLGHTHKNINIVAYPEYLDISPYIYIKHDNIEHRTLDNTQYRLNCVICQTGSIHGGHYYAYVRHLNNEWYICNDTKTSKVNVQDVLKDDQNAYILFYAR